MSNVSKRIFPFLASALFFAFPAMAAEEVSGKTFYTTANIWYERPVLIESTNYHKGTVLPIGTKVKIKEVFDGTRPITTATWIRTCGSFLSGLMTRADSLTSFFSCRDTRERV